MVEWAARSPWPRPWQARASWESTWIQENREAHRNRLLRSRGGEPGRRAVDTQRRAQEGRSCVGRTGRQLRDVLPELVRRGEAPDILTDQTSAHDELNGYIPNGMTLEEARELRNADPDEYVRGRLTPWASTFARCSPFSAWAR